MNHPIVITAAVSQGTDNEAFAGHPLLAFADELQKLAPTHMRSFGDREMTEELLLQSLAARVNHLGGKGAASGVTVEWASAKPHKISEDGKKYVKEEANPALAVRVRVEGGNPDGSDGQMGIGISLQVAEAN